MFGEKFAARSGSWFCWFLMTTSMVACFEGGFSIEGGQVWLGCSADAGRIDGSVCVGCLWFRLRRGVRLKICGSG